MNLVEPAHRQAVLIALVADIRSRTNSVTAGDVGYRYVIRALADGGRSDVLYDLNNQSERPGYGYQLRKGATSLTEAWDARRGSSQNHFMLGQIMEWFYHDLAGIRPDPELPGFAHVQFRPQPVGELNWVTATYHSVRGPVRSRWRVQDRTFRLEVSIPPNSTATVWVPGDHARVENLKRSQRRSIRTESTGGVTAFTVPAGRYVFVSSLTSAGAARRD
jgi:alpha-L-rhamnosidase